MTWEIYSYGAGAFLAMIFNGIASIFNDAQGNYRTALSVAAMVAFVSVFVGLATRTRDFSITWIFIIVFVVLGLFVPRVPVIITDKLVPANTTVVGNVPVGLAIPAVAFSRFGHWAAESFETVFSLPNEVQYHGNGLLFAQHLVEESTRFEFVTPRLSENYTDFFKSCVAYDLLFDLYNWDQLLSANDISAFLQSNTSQARSFTYRDAAGASSIINCRTGYDTKMVPDLAAEITAANTVFGGRLALGDTTTTASVARFVAAMPVAYTHLTGLSVTQAKIMSQNMVANSLKRGVSSFASETGSAALAQEYAAARAEQERRTTFATMGMLAKRMLPVLHTLFEAFIYAAFPIVALLLMLPMAGKVLLNYARALFWINLWPPLYAILHFSMTYFSQTAATRQMVQAGAGFPSGLTAMTHTGLGEVMYDYSVLAGYLSISIPLIAWLLVSNSGAVLASVAGRIMSSYESPVSTGASEASTGNIGLGNTRFDTQTAFQQNLAPSSKTMGIDYGDGVNSTRMTPSTVMTDLSASKTPVAVDFGESSTAIARSNLSNASATEQRASAELSSSNSALLSKVEQFNRSVNESDSGQSLLGNSSYSAFTQAQQNLDRAIASSSSSDSITMDNARALSASLAGSARAGIGTPGGSPVDAGVGIGGGINGSYSDRLTDSNQSSEVRQAMASKEVSDAITSYAQAARTFSASYSLGTSDTTSDSIGSTLNEQQQAAERYSIASQDVTSATLSLESAKQIGTSMNVNGADGYFNYLAGEQGMSQDRIRSLISGVNEGNAAAIQQNNALVADYVQSQLGPNGYGTQLPAMTELGAGGQIAGRDAGFDGASSAQNQLLEQGGQQISQGIQSNQDRVSASAYAGSAAVSSANTTDYLNRDEARGYSSDIASENFAKQMGNPRSLMVPAPGYEAVRSDIQDTREQLQNEQATEENTGLFERQLDKIP